MTKRIDVMCKKVFIILLTTIVFNLSASDEIQMLNSLECYKTQNNDTKRLLQSILGDTIQFEIGDNSKSLIFVSENPDTIWIKERPKKNPKEGKHYTLNPRYKGVLDNTGVYETPKYEIEGKNFKVVSAYYGTYSSYNKDLVLELLELASSEKVKCYVLARENSSVSIRSMRLEKMLYLLKDKIYYINSTGYYDFKKTFIKTYLKGCEYKIFFDVTDAKVILNSDLKLMFVSEDGIYVDYVPQTKKEDAVLSETEYIEYEKSIAPKVINSNINDSIRSLNIHLPFSAKFILGEVNKDNVLVSQTIDPTRLNFNKGLRGMVKVPKKTVLCITDEFDIAGYKYFTALLNGKAMFVGAEDVELTTEMRSRLDSLMLCDNSQKEFYFHKSLYRSESGYLVECLKAINEIESFSKYGLAISRWRVYDESDYVDGTGVIFEFYNPTRKRIKYITIKMVGYNAVDDCVIERGETIKTRECVGPIEPGVYANYVFECVWDTDLVEYAKIKSIIVKYMDGSSQVINNIEDITFSDELIKNLSTKDPVKGFE